ncbi:MAG TPA: isoprenylcysteine carboxylmethyltransferase family protein [Gammaproteobacteria bacterium]|nr:isoprenylcysteine carboxylmethyltransferase family protein [Gammaproteobacteria bacterium]
MPFSNRTKDLPPLAGPAGWARDLRYHEASRQCLAGILILLYTLTATPAPVLLAIGAVLVLLGLAVRMYASGYIAKNKELATDGPYALVRHPLYTGNLLALLGFAIANGRWWAVPLVLAFFWFYYPPAIQYEDRKLKALFGAAWEHWSRSVPALWPSFRNLRGLEGGHWSIRKSFAKNGEILIALYAVVCIVLIAHGALGE